MNTDSVMHRHADLDWHLVDVHHDKETGHRVRLLSTHVDLAGTRVRIWMEERWALDKPIWNSENKCIHRAYWCGAREDRDRAVSSVLEAQQKYVQTKTAEPCL